MKQSSLDIVMNNVLDTIYNSNIDNIEKIELDKEYYEIAKKRMEEE